MIDPGEKRYQVNVLVHNPATSRFPPDTFISDIVKQLMVDQWNPIFAFDRYYSSCAPINCVGSQTTNFSIFVLTIITLISTLGGLITVLRLITHVVIEIIVKLSKFSIKRQRRQQQQPKGSYSCDHTVIKHSPYVIVRNADRF